ncbi:hypothetical protein C0431_15605 [bacterium]|nr:hypothetical protein [bacterium]
MTQRASYSIAATTYPKELTLVTQLLPRINLFTRRKTQNCSYLSNKTEHEKLFPHPDKVSEILPTPSGKLIS